MLNTTYPNILKRRRQCIPNFGCWCSGVSCTFEPLLPSFLVFPQADIRLEHMSLCINVYTNKCTNPMGNQIAELEVSFHYLNLPVFDVLQIHYHFGIKLILTNLVIILWLSKQQRIKTKSGKHRPQLRLLHLIRRG
jgi:hypothetical protein